MCCLALLPSAKTGDSMLDCIDCILPFSWIFLPFSCMEIPVLPYGTRRTQDFLGFQQQKIVEALHMPLQSFAAPKNTWASKPISLATHCNNLETHCTDCQRIAHASRCVLLPLLQWGIAAYNVLQCVSYFMGILRQCGEIAHALSHFLNSPHCLMFFKIRESTSERKS